MTGREATADGWRRRGALEGAPRATPSQAPRASARAALGTAFWATFLATFLARLSTRLRARLFVGPFLGLGPRFFVGLFTGLFGLTPSILAGPAAAQSDLNRTLVVGWPLRTAALPFGFMEEHGVLDRWAARYGLTVELRFFEHYDALLSAYAAGALDAAALTNVDALVIAVNDDVDTTVIAAAAASNGGDAIWAAGAASMRDLQNGALLAPEAPVARYLAHRCLEEAGLSVDALRVRSLPTPALLEAMAAAPDAAVAFWTPSSRALPAAQLSGEACSSRSLPGEIWDVIVMRSDVLERAPDFAYALTGAWYETLAHESFFELETIEGLLASRFVADMSADALADTAAQARLLKNGDEAITLMTGGQARRVMTQIRRSSWRAGLFAPRITDLSMVGVRFGSVDDLVSTEPTRLSFDARFVERAMLLFQR